MIDLHFARENPVLFCERVRKKEPSFDAQKLLQLDAQLRDLQRIVEELRHQRKMLAAQHKAPSDELREQARTVHQALKDHEQKLDQLEHQFKQLYLYCPNLPLSEVPEGNKEANLVVKTWGNQPTFSFNPRHHLDLNDHAKWFDLTAAARMAGSQFVWYNTTGASLIYTLAMFMMQHNQRHGYQLMLPPYLVNEASLEGAAQFPKFRDGVYGVKDEDLYTIPTSEVSLTAFYRDHTFVEEELPVRMTSWTSCFRREAGAYGASERGLIRVHQFEKVELYTLCTPEQASIEHERMLACGEEILQALGLHYRISLLAGQDSSFAAAKTYDIEVWLPGQKEYREVSSSSLCTDFQARRCSIRYKSSPAAKSQLVYTLNSSSLALPRIMVALMETYQQENGSIVLPCVLDSVCWKRTL
jgi:seryl-tRNA synthetase